MCINQRLVVQIEIYPVVGDIPSTVDQGPDHDPQTNFQLSRKQSRNA